MKNKLVEIQIKRGVLDPVASFFLVAAGLKSREAVLGLQDLNGLIVQRHTFVQPSGEPLYYFFTDFIASLSTYHEASTKVGRIFDWMTSIISILDLEKVPYGFDNCNIINILTISIINSLIIQRISNIKNNCDDA